jgi:uncharacterized OsmC-like protein
MGIKARDQGIDMNGTRIEMTKKMSAEPPRRIEAITMHLFFPEKNWSEEEKLILEEASRSCPVCRSLSENLKTSLHLHWVE